MLTDCLHAFNRLISIGSILYSLDSSMLLFFLTLNNALWAPSVARDVFINHVELFFFLSNPIRWQLQQIYSRRSICGLAMCLHTLTHTKMAALERKMNFIGFGFRPKRWIYYTIADSISMNLLVLFFLNIVTRQRAYCFPTFLQLADSSSINRLNFSEIARNWMRIWREREKKKWSPISIESCLVGIIKYLWLPIKNQVKPKLSSI